MTFDLDREGHEQDGTEWMYGDSSAIDLAAVPQLERMAYQPQGEVQFGADDFEDCATRAPINILASKFTYRYAKGLFLTANKQWLEANGYVVDGKIDFSDRFISILSGTTRQGNSLKAPLEAIRKNGLIPKSMLPAGYLTFDEYQNPAVITKAMRDLGAEFARRFTLNYEQVLSVDFVHYLAEDELNVSLFAWPAPVNGVYPRSEEPFDHAIKIIKPDFFALDNYIDFSGGFIKELAGDYKFYDYGYRVILTAETADPAVTQKQGLLALLMEIFGLRALLDSLRKPAASTSPQTPVIAPPVNETPKPAPAPPPTTSTPPTPQITPEYDWSTPDAARHSARVIMDEMGLTGKRMGIEGKIYSVKDVLCACLTRESGFRPRAIGKVNSDGTQDFGLAQYNNGHNPKTGEAYWIGPGADFANEEEVLSDPEKNVRVFVRSYKDGLLHLWSSYSTGAFKQYL